MTRRRHLLYVLALLTALLAAEVHGTDRALSSLQPPLTMNDASYIWDLRGSYRVTRHLAATAAVDNATNAEYFEPLGFPAPGRVARAGVRVTF